MGKERAKFEEERVRLRKAAASQRDELVSRTGRRNVTTGYDLEPGLSRSQDHVTADSVRQALPKRRRPVSYTAKREKPPDILGVLFMRHDLNGDGCLQAPELQACLTEVFGEKVLSDFPDIVEQVLSDFPDGVSRLEQPSGNLCKDFYEIFDRVDRLVSDRTKGQKKKKNK